MPLTENQISAEPNHHRVLPPKSGVDHQCADENSRKSDGPKQKLPFRGPLQITILDYARYDRPRENAIREGDKVIQEPRPASADERFPVPLDRKPVRYAALIFLQLEKKKSDR